MSQPVVQTPVQTLDRHATREKLFRYSAVGSLAFEVAFVVAVVVALIAYTDVRTFLQAVTADETLFSIKLTLVTVTLSTAISMVLAIPAGYALTSYKFPFSSVVDTLLDLPIVLPPVAAGFALLILFGYYLGDPMEEIGLFLPHSQVGIVVAQFFATMTFAVRSVRAALESVNARLPAVARTLGSNRWRAFRRVTLPLARNGIIAGGVLSWARCLGLFGPVVMFCGATRYRTEILPTAIFLNNSVGRLEEAVAGTLILLLLAVLTLILFKRLGNEGFLF
ncbi:MAG: ABC transporter permease [Armatimonadetes bacterium]|nr:ABC transporter permease [Armatimonadota bacterium]